MLINQRDVISPKQYTTCQTHELEPGMELIRDDTYTIEKVKMTSDQVHIINSRELSITSICNPPTLDDSSIIIVHISPPRKLAP